MALNGHFSHSLLTHNNSPFSRRSSRTKSPLFFTIFTSPQSSSPCSSTHKPINPNARTRPTEEENSPIYMNRRVLNLSISTLILSTNPLPKSMAAEQEEEQQELGLVRYTDSKEGFTLLKPSSWVKVDKAGATVLFEDPSKGANNVGVVVTPVRLTKLEDFGNPQFVVDKLIQAEKRKESTKDAVVISALERSGQGGLQVYEFEYQLDSTRGGMKRIFSAAFVASKKLYLLNIAHSDKPESPLDTETRTMLEEVLHSFNVAPST